MSYSKAAPLAVLISMGIASSAYADPERPVAAAVNPAVPQVQATGTQSNIQAINLAGACLGASDSFANGFEAGGSANGGGAVSLWSDSATWGGAVPGAGVDVTIPAGKQVVLDVITPRLGNVSIAGQLLAAQTLDVGLHANRISVAGPGSALVFGCAAQPYIRNAEIVLYGANLTSAQIVQGQKGILASTGALLSFYGQPKTAWSKLAANVAAGSSSISLLQAPMGWRVGDEIVIAPSGFDANQYDVRTIASVNGAQISLSQPLSYPHWGSLQNYGGKVLDERAAVGLLTRNIVVRGAGDANAEKLGAHVMVMAGATAQVDGVAFRSGGQARHPGRYPFHWHFAGDRASDFIRNSVVRDSFQRAIVVHQTNGVTVENNVAFRISNHAFVWSEDGNEVNNKFINNLGIYTTSPLQADFAFPLDNALQGNSSQAEFRSATFWGRNFNNTLTGNIAAGSIDGMGFFFDRFSPSVNPDEGTGLVFQNNTAHSHYRPGSNAVAGEIYPEATTGHGLMVTANTGTEEHQFSSFTGYKNYGGAWLEDRRSRLKNSVLADNGAGVIMLRGVLDDAVIIGASANAQGGIAARVGGFGLGLSGGVHLPSSHGGVRAPQILNTKFFNQRDAAFTFDVDYLGLGARVENIQYTNTPNRFAYQEAPWFEYDYTTHVLDDPQGQLLDGSTPTRWFKRRSQQVSASCVAVAGAASANAYACPMSESMTLRYTNAPSRWTYFTESSGAVHGFGQPWYFDQALSQSDSLGVLRSGARYDVFWPSDAQRQTIELELSDSAGKASELAFSAASGAVTATQNGAPLRAASSVADLRSGTGSAYFYDAPANRLRVKLAGAAGLQRFLINAAFVNTATVDARASEVQTGLVPGLRLEQFSAAPQSLRNAKPSLPALSSVNLNIAQVTRSTVASTLTDAAGVSVLQGFINAPVAGIYTFSAPAAGGSVDLYVGDKWVTGSIANEYPVVNDPSPDTRDESNLFALAQGWHPITIVYSRSAGQSSFQRGLWLRWALPGSSTFNMIPVFRHP